jgi:alpha-1,3-rhamnosyl/mannosyltransferase
MRVLINTLLGLGRKTGIGRYTAELVAALGPHLQPGETLTSFPDGWLRSVCSWLRGLSQGRASAGTGAPTWSNWLKGKVVQLGRAFLENRFSAALRRQRYDLYHDPNNLPMPADVPTIVTLHDLSVLLYPQWHPAARVVHYERSFAQGLGRCAHILTDTAAVRREIIQHLGVGPERVTTTPLGVQPGMRPQPEEEVAARLRALKLPPRYLLSVGTLEPRKNQLLLLRAYVRLPARVRASFPLLLVGGLGWNIDELRSYLDRTARQAGVIHLGYVADADLAVLYNGARALLFPSFYEGFGLPPLEMQACGGAVIASTADAVAEVLAGSPACLLDPHDEDAWAATMLRVCTDEEFWQTLRTGAIQAAGRFTWQRCAAQTLAVYRQVASASRPLRLSA